MKPAPAPGKPAPKVPGTKMKPKKGK